MPAPATHDFVHLEISSASVLNTSINGPLNYLIGRNLGSDDAIELEDSLEILSGSGGATCACLRARPASGPRVRRGCCA